MVLCRAEGCESGPYETCPKRNTNTFVISRISLYEGFIFIFGYARKIKVFKMNYDVASVYTVVMTN